MMGRCAAAALLGSVAAFLLAIRCSEGQSCSAMGSLHFMTFDSKEIDFPYQCKYVFAKTCSRLARVSFDIRIQVKPSGSERAASVQYVEVVAEGKTVQLHRNGIVMSDGVIMEALNFKCKLRVHRVPLGTQLTIESANVTVTINENGFVLVTVPDILKRLLCGLCGNFDGNKEDDNPLQSLSEYFIANPSDSRCSAPPAVVRVARSSRTCVQSYLCESINSTSDVFSSCVESHPALTEAFRRFCQHDVCMTSDDVSSGCSESPDGCDPGGTQAGSVCSLSEALAVLCGERGRPPELGWRGTQACAKECPAGSVYVENATSCTRVCGMSCNAQIPLCVNQRYTDGCACPGGGVWSGISCVPNTGGCGCNYGSGYYPVGAKWLDNTCSAELECTAGSSQPSYAQIECAANGNCALINDTYRCVCPDGYEGDGRRECNRVCNPGERVTDANDGCENCPIGTYQPTRNSNRSCLNCPNGYLTMQGGSKEVSQCVDIEYLPTNDAKVACTSTECGKRLFVPPEILQNGIPFGSSSHRVLLVSSNGLIAFDDNFLGRTAKDLSIPGIRPPIIAPFWFRQDFGRYPASVLTVEEHNIESSGKDKMQLISMFLSKAAVSSTNVKPNYNAAWAVIATWTDAIPFPHQSHEVKPRGSGIYENSTYQAILVSDGKTTYVGYVYPRGRLHLSGQNVLRQAQMGYNSGDGTAFRFYGSGTLLMGKLDELASNTGIPGKWLFEISSEVRSPPELQACLQWYAQQVEWYPFLPPTSYKCPSEAQMAMADPAFQMDTSIWCAVSRFPHPVSKMYQMCCYEKSPTTGIRKLVVDPTTAGRPLYYNPNKPAHRNHYIIADEKPFLDCCHRTQNCNLYRQYRPADSGEGYVPPKSGGAYGDPHFQTVDGLEYTFNAIGEFHFLKSHTMLIQTRLGKVRVGARGTDFHAVAAQQTMGSRVHVEVNGDKTGLIIHVKPPGGSSDTDVTTVFTGLENTEQAYELVTISGAKSKLRISFANGYTLDVSVPAGALQLSVYVPPSEKNTSISGLLGNFDGNAGNDLTTPNGTIVRCPQGRGSSQCIHEFFGSAWRIQQQSDSIFWYRENFGINSYTDMSFMPAFMEEITFADPIPEFCNGSYQCAYDYRATDSRPIAEATASVVSERKATHTILAKVQPEIKAYRQVIHAVVNEPVSFSFDVNTNVSGVVKLQNLSLPVGAVIRQTEKLFVLSWTPTVSLAGLPIRLVAVDAEGTTSAIFTIKVALCNCIDHDSCMWPRESIMPEVLLVTCNCSEGWTGPTCSDDFDSCQDQPCGGGQCIDLPPGQPTSYNCSCNEGFRISNIDSQNAVPELQESCLDVNECDDDPCDENENCVNTVGSYLCLCNEGYKYDNRTKKCEDIDECAVDMLNRCQHICANVNGSHACSCFPGFEMIDGICNKVQGQESGCDHLRCSYACINSSTGFQCICPKGFRFRNGSASGSECIDIDECAEFSPCGMDASCSNANGSYECTCQDGFKFTEDRSCKECPSGTYGKHCSQTCNCGMRAATCNSTHGCVNCAAGWRGNQCTQDVNECLSPGTCSGANVECVNTLGSYTCTCQGGYERMVGATDCVDIDECSVLLLPCRHPGFTCVNVPGSFKCICQDGYAQNGSICADIDECLNAYKCHPQADCTNTVGSYKCQCPTGYVGDGQQGDGGQGCVDVDECTANDRFCPLGSNCTNTPGSFVCSCLNSYEPLDECCVDTRGQCFRNLAGCSTVKACCLQNGNYTCSCATESATTSDTRCGTLPNPLYSGATSDGTTTVGDRATSTPWETANMTDGTTSNATAVTTSQPPSTSDANVTARASKIAMSHSLTILPSEVNKESAVYHIQEALQNLLDQIKGFKELSKAVTTPLNSSPSEPSRKRALDTGSHYQVTYNATFEGVADDPKEAVYRISVAIAAAKATLQLRNITILLDGPLHFSVHGNEFARATCLALGACREVGSCQLMFRHFPICKCLDGSDSFVCQQPKMTEPPVAESDYLPLWITVGVLGGLLVIAAVAVLTALMIRRHRRAVNLHREDTIRQSINGNSQMLGTYLGGLFRPFGRRQNVHRRSRTSSTSPSTSTSSSSTDSYHSSPEGRVGAAVPFGPRWPKAYAKSSPAHPEYSRSVGTEDVDDPW